MRRTEFELETVDGPMWVYEVVPSAVARASVIFLMDGGGYRPALLAMADRLSSSGYRVLLPDLFHRVGSKVHFDPAWFAIPEKMAEIRSTIGALTNEMALRDISACLDLLNGRSDADPNRVGAVGYCMGGRHAFVAATHFTDRLRATASIHPGGVVTESPTSPHRGVEKLTAKVYFGVAKNDRSFTYEQTQTLEAQLEGYNKRYKLDHYDALHGWAVNDALVYDQAEAERHWRAVLSLFAEELQAPE